MSFSFFPVVSGLVFEREEGKNDKQNVFLFRWFFRLFVFSPVPEREQIAPVCAWKYSYYYVNEMLYKSMSENNDNSELFKLSVLFHLP